ncbi:hypothetical protein HAINFHK1212_1123 [Haemophilus influenzae HK1212]|uniref:Uncharacterized protein n=1 Tax=Haemophilus influenzae HK1212 TaxID=456482 RepID=A0A7G2K290_HAEIF|nr:hypothetical protein HAINFHK1212_1123 [Haemophilus influenzae HK1212]
MLIQVPSELNGVNEPFSLSLEKTSAFGLSRALEKRTISGFVDLAIKVLDPVNVKVFSGLTPNLSLD